MYNNGEPEKDSAVSKKMKTFFLWGVSHIIITQWRKQYYYAAYLPPFLRN